MITKEISEIINIIAQICAQYREITPNFLSETFGLKLSISNKLLTILTDKFKILEKIDNNGENYFKVNESVFYNLNLTVRENLTLPQINNFSFCLNPLIWVEKRLNVRDLGDISYRDIIFQSLKRFDEIMRTGNNLKVLYQIPPNNRSINFSGGILVNGLTIGKLIWKDEKFVLFKDDKRICQVSKEHPDYEQINDELKEIQSNTSLIHTLIEEKLKKQLDDENFDIKLDINNRQLKVKIYENNIEHFSRIFRIFIENDNKLLSIPLKNDWIYAISLNLECANPSMDFLIKSFKALETQLQENFSTLVNREKSVYLSKIDSLIKEFKDSFENTTMPVNLENFISVLKEVCRTSNNGWYHMLYAKLIENEVFDL